MTEHKQVGFTTARGHLTQVDEGLRPLLSAMRSLGVETQYSCENNFGRAYVSVVGSTARKMRLKLLGTVFTSQYHTFEFSHYLRRGEYQFFRKRFTTKAWD